ncbi:MAG: HEAT repeat domain-containing protein, partial [Vicinamibacterales bacterium]
LGTQRRPSAVDALIGALEDPDANVRFHAIESLGRLAPPAAISRLAHIAESGDFYLAFPAIEALIRINDPLVAPRLAPLLRDPILGASAAAALAQLGDEDSVDALVDAIGTSETPTIALAEALVQIHSKYQSSFAGGEEIEDIVRRRLSPEGLRRVLESIDRSSGHGVRTLVVLLGWLRDPAIPPALARLLGSVEARHDVIEAFVRCGPSSVTLLVEQLAGEDIDITRSAVVALGRIGDRRAVPALVSILDERPRELWVPVISALARIGDVRAFESLLRLLGDSDVAVRQAAVGALNSIGHSETVIRVCALLGDASALLRESAVKVAGYFGYPECVDAVLTCCTDPNESVRAAALEHLPYFDDPRAGDVLARAVAGEAPRSRAAAAKALGAMSGPAAIESLQAALRDEEPWVRYFAAISMGRHQDAATLQQLAGLATGDPAPHVRVAAVEAIGAIGGEHAMEILKPLAENNDGDSSLSALRVLGHSQSDGIGSTLCEAVRSSDPHRRLAAVEALAHWGREQAVEPLQWAASADSDSAVSAAALEGLCAIANRNSSGSRAAIHAALQSVSDPVRREQALTVLGRLAPSAIPLVAESLNADDPHLRHGVVEVLGRLTHPAASACLQRALSDADASVRRDAVRALSRFGTRGLARRFSAMAEKDVSAAVREAAAAALSRQSNCPEGRE